MQFFYSTKKRGLDLYRGLSMKTVNQETGEEITEQKSDGKNKG